MYIEGDKIPGLGTVDTNHCGLPWVTTDKGQLCGVVQVTLFDPMNFDYKKHGYENIRGYVFADAISGEVLTPKETNARLENIRYDYEHKNSEAWRILYRNRIKKNRIFRLRDETFWETVERIIYCFFKRR